MVAALLTAGLVLAAGPAGAQGRPSEAEMFGTPSAPASAPSPSSPDGGVAPERGAAQGGGAGSDPATASSPANPAGPTVGTPAAPATAAGSGPPAVEVSGGAQPVRSRDQDILGDPNAGPRLSEETAPEDPLKVGGQIYLRSFYRQPGSPVFDLSNPNMIRQTDETTFSAPSLVDAYFDARPNERVRAFVLGRLFFDPTLPTQTTQQSITTPGQGPTGMPAQMTGTGGAFTPTVPLLSGVSATRGPSTILDQLWMRFDIKRVVFVTAGRQHVKWGTARFWTPTDYLHPERRNPVAVFDARPGFTMLKLHLPWEEHGWNFYAFALVEGVRRLDRTTGRLSPGSDVVRNVGDIGGAARAELVLGTAELGLGGVFYRDQKPRWAADLSVGLGDFDLYADAGFRYGSELPRVRADGSIDYVSGIKPQITAGGTWSRKYNDNDVFTMAGEYFYNSRGYNDPRLYPALFVNGLFEFFYTGRHYAALSAILAAPWSWNYTTFTLTTLGNLSDQSFLSRLDYSLVILTHLRFEAFVAVNYGRRAGEFRLGVDNLNLGNGQSISLEPQSFSAGLGLRVGI